MNQQETRDDNGLNDVHVMTKTDAESFCSQFHETVHHLHEAIENETACLKAMNIEGVEYLQNSKSALSRTYARDINAFKANAVEIGKLAPKSVDDLRKKHRLLRAAIVENEQILGVVKDVSASLIRRTAERVANANQPKTYNASAAGAISQQTAAVACDRKL